jgi:hypothetical protein
LGSGHSIQYIKARTNNATQTLLSLNTMAYVQVEADDVRINAILLVLLQHLIFVHSNGSKKGQKLSSSNVLLAVSIRDYLSDLSSEQHS